MKKVVICAFLVIASMSSFSQTRQTLRIKNPLSMQDQPVFISDTVSVTEQQALRELNGVVYRIKIFEYVFKPQRNHILVIRETPMPAGQHYQSTLSNSFFNIGVPIDNIGITIDSEKKKLVINYESNRRVRFIEFQ